MSKKIILLYVVLVFQLVAGCYAGQSIAVRREYNKVQGLLNLWDSNREDVRIRMLFVEPGTMIDPPPTVDMLSSVSVLQVTLDGRRYAKWSKRMLSSILAEPWVEADLHPVYGYCIQIEAPWDGVLLKIAISPDRKIWNVDGINIKASSAMIGWAERYLVQCFNSVNGSLETEN